MTAAEILEEIRRLPAEQQQELKDKLLTEPDPNVLPFDRDRQAEFDRMLFEDGFLVNLPVDSVEDDDDFEPVEIKGEPLSQTIINERR
jgi:hypothetical protein